MRRALIFLILLAIMFGIALIVYSAYSNHDQVAELVDLSSDSRYLDSNGNFSGRFKYNDDKIRIKNFSYMVIGDDLYIAVFVAATADGMETDEDGYALIEISGLPDIDKVYYVDGKSLSVLPTDRE